MTIKEFRQSQGLSQPKLAQALGIGTSTIGGYETGRINPSEKVIEKIKEVFGVDLYATAALAAAEKPRRGRRKKAEAAQEAPEVQAEPKAEEEPKAKKSAGRKPRAAKAPAIAAPTIVIQSPMGGSITPEEIIAKVGEVDSVYVRVDENKAYWVKGEESGSVDLW